MEIPNLDPHIAKFIAGWNILRAKTP